MARLPFLILTLGVIYSVYSRRAFSASDLKYCKKDGKYEVIMRPPSKVEVNVGDRVSLVCAAHGHDTLDPLVYWVKGVGPEFENEGKNLGPVAIGKSVLFFDKIKEEDVDTYKCVIESCCDGQSDEIDIDVIVPQATCEDKYGIGNVVYGAVWEFKLFSEAVQYCADLGLELALPRSEEENNKLLEDVQNSFDHHPNADKYSQENWLWIAASDEIKEGTFLDLKTGEELKYKNFAKKQPDNWTDGGKYPKGQDYVGFNRVGGTWDDSFGHYKRPFACLCPQD